MPVRSVVLLSLLISAVSSLHPLPAIAVQSVTLTWEASPSLNVAGYNVYYGAAIRTYTMGAPAGNATVVQLNDLLEGVTYYFAVTAYDDSGQESDLSNEVMYNVPGVPPPLNAPSIQQTSPDQGTQLNWSPSTGTDIVGYNVYYGTESGSYGSVIFVNDATATIYGLVEDVAYYFAVTAVDSLGEESVPSPEAAYIPQTVVITPEPVLSIQPLAIEGFPNSFLINATGPIPPMWTLEASSDLKIWKPLITSADWTVNVTVVISPKPTLFFRLNSLCYGIELQLQKGDFPNSFSIGTAYVIPWEWTLESSEDLQNWSTFTTGFFAPVNVVIVSLQKPAMFFRLKGE